MVSMSCDEVLLDLNIGGSLKLLVMWTTLGILGFELRPEEVEGCDGQYCVEQIIILERCVDYFCPIEFMNIGLLCD